NAEATQPLPIVEGKAKAIVTEAQAAKRRSTTDQFIFQRRTLAIKVSSSGPFAQAQDDTSANIVCDSLSPANVEIGAASDKTNSGGWIRPCRTPESRPPPEHVVMDKDQAGPDLGKIHGAPTGPDHEPTHDEFMADLYPKV
nr:hypothetical protein [Tanacetum cinerariifolium]